MSGHDLLRVLLSLAALAACSRFKDDPPSGQPICSDDAHAKSCDPTQAFGDARRIEAFGSAPTATADIEGLRLDRCGNAYFAAAGLRGDTGSDKKLYFALRYGRTSFGAPSRLDKPDTLAGDLDSPSSSADARSLVFSKESP